MENETRILIRYDGVGNWTTRSGALRAQYPYCLYVPEDATDEEIDAEVTSACLDDSDNDWTT
jgi:hypothetical protein